MEKYDPKKHESDYHNMFMEYGEWLDEQVVKHYGVHLFPYGDIEKLVDRVLPNFTSYDPTEGIILILKVEGETAGMVRMNKFKDDIGMVHNMFVYPSFRRRGLAMKMMQYIEDKAREWGYNYLRLDTGGFNVAAQKLYLKLGYVEIERFTETAALENPETQQYYDEKVHMEKKLNR